MPSTTIKRGVLRAGPEMTPPRRPNHGLAPASPRGTTATLWTLSGILLAACGGGGGGGGGTTAPITNPDGTRPLPKASLPMLAITPSMRVEENAGWQMVAQVEVTDADDSAVSYRPGHFELLNTQQGEYRVMPTGTAGTFRIEARNFDFEHDSLMHDTASPHDMGRMTVSIRVVDASNRNIHRIKEFNFYLLNVNEAPSIAQPPGLNIGQGDRLALTESVLLVTDPDGDDNAEGGESVMPRGDAITFMVTAKTNGKIVRDTNPAPDDFTPMDTDTFTLAELRSGAVHFVHDGGDDAAASFSVSVSDDGGATGNEVTVRVAVNLNPVPVVHSVDDGVIADTPIDDGALAARGIISATDASTPSRNLSYTVAGKSGTTIAGSGVVSKGNTAYGTLTLTGNEWRFIADASGIDRLPDGDSVTLDFTATVSNAASHSDSEDFTITLRGANDLPVLVVNGLDNQVVENIDETASGTLIATDRDSDDAAFTYRGRHGTSGTYTEAGAISGDYGTLTLGTDGRWQYDLASDAPGSSESFTFTATDDGNGESNVVTVIIHITAGNDDPFLTLNAGGDTTVKKHADAMAGGSFTAGDPDDALSALTFRVSVAGGAFADIGTAPVAGTYGDLTIDGAAGTWSYTLDETRPATEMLGKVSVEEVFALAVRDDDGAASATATITIGIDATNDAPTLGVNNLVPVMDERTDPESARHMAIVTITDTDGTRDYEEGHLEVVHDSDFRFSVFRSSVIPLGENPATSEFTLRAENIDFEDPALTDGRLTVRVRATDPADSRITTESEAVVFTIRDVNEAPTLSPSSEPIPIGLLDRLVLDTSMFTVRDPDAGDNGDNMLFTVGEVTGGFVEKHDPNAFLLPWKSTNTFTLGDLRGGDVAFSHFGGADSPAFFTLKATDDDGLDSPFVTIDFEIG